jgi:hypothetical protein
MHSSEIYRQQNRVVSIAVTRTPPSTTWQCCVTSRDLRGQIISRIVRIFPTVRPASDMHIEYFREFFIRRGRNTHFPPARRTTQQTLNNKEIADGINLIQYGDPGAT